MRASPFRLLAIGLFAGGLLTAGAAKCRTCHLKEFNIWAASPHTTAYEKLSPEERKKPECVACHVTGQGKPAEAGIRRSVTKYFEENHQEIARARTPDIARASTVAVDIYRRNVFPRMRIAWGTYPSMIGHTDTSGCFRCHDGEHVSADGRPITNDCDACHTLLAVEEADPEILKQLSP